MITHQVFTKIDGRCLLGLHHFIFILVKSKQILFIMFYTETFKYCASNITLLKVNKLNKKLIAIYCSINL